MPQEPVPLTAVVAPVLRPTPADHPEAVILVAADGRTPLRMVLAHHGYRPGQRVKIEPLPPDDGSPVPTGNGDTTRPDWGRALPCPEEEAIERKEVSCVGKHRS